MTLLRQLRFVKAEEGSVLGSRETPTTCQIEMQRDGLRVLATIIRGRGLRKLDMISGWTITDLANSFCMILMPGESVGPYSSGATGLNFSRVIDRQTELLIKNHGQKFTLRLLQVLARPHL